jgi:hypothetical protein|tara:strand:+ start:10936 stop:11550 length:615 start_codon:yes stop_codon:yes gene_type:complete
MDNNFLNKKEIPSNRQILNFFFPKEEIDEILSNLEYSSSNSPESVKELGEPDEVQTIVGTEWELSRVRWSTDKGPKYQIYLKNIGISFTDITFSNPNLEYNYNMNSTNDNPFSFFNYNGNIKDIDFDEVELMTYQDQLDYAVEIEDFDEAARLRDWNNGLLELLLKLKPKFIQAIETDDLEALDIHQNILNEYRATLNTKPRNK